jgi:hypothetical protein
MGINALCLLFFSSRLLTQSFYSYGGRHPIKLFLLAIILYGVLTFLKPFIFHWNDSFFQKSFQYILLVVLATIGYVGGLFVMGEKQTASLLLEKTIFRYRKKIFLVKKKDE